MSYWHLVGVAARYGETEAGAAYLLPISVDGLVIVASVSLVELTARIRAADTQQQLAPQAATTSRADAPAAQAAQPPAAPIGAAAARRRQADRDDGTADHTRQKATARPAPRHGRGTTDRRPDAEDNRGRDQLSDEPLSDPAMRRGDILETPDVHADEPNPADGRTRADGAVPSETAAAVAYWYRRDPGLHPAEIAAKIGRSERTVRRYWPPCPATSPDAIADRAADLADSLRR